MEAGREAGPVPLMTRGDSIGGLGRIHWPPASPVRRTTHAVPEFQTMRTYLKTIAFAASMGVAALSVYLLIVGKDLLIPLALAIFFWFLINAIARIVRKVRIGRWRPWPWLSLAIGVAALVAAVAISLQLISGSIANVIDAAPRYQENVQSLIERGARLAGLDAVPDVMSIAREIDLAAAAKGLAGFLTTVAGSTGIIVIYVLFLLLEQQTFSRKLAAVFTDPKREAKAKAMIEQIAVEMQSYLSIKTALAIVTGVVTWALLEAIGLDFPVFWGFLTFLLYYIPTIGSAIALVLPVLMALVQFESLYPALYVILVVGGIQTAIANVVEPRLLGQRLNLSAFVIILSLFVWGAI